MSRSKQMRQEAAHLRGRIERRACFISQRIDRLMLQLRALARSPVALPVAFVSGMLAERLPVPGIKYAFGLLAGQAKAMQVASSLIDSPVR